MIYVCIPARDEAPTAGLVLWKTRKVFQEFGREYQLLVAEDGSSDGTGETLAPYANVLPLSLLRGGPGGYAAAVESLFRLALERSDRPRRDCAVLLHADFAHGPQWIPELVREIDSGADLVVAEGRVGGESSTGYRVVRRFGPWLLRSAVGVPGVHDVISGFLAVRLSCLRLALRDRQSPFLRTDGWAANAELIARMGAVARRVETVPVIERHDLRDRPTRVAPWPRALALWRARARVRDATRAGT